MPAMIVAAGFLDLEQFNTTFVRSHLKSLKDDPSWPGAQTLHLRDEKGDLPILKDWNSARQVLARIRNEAALLPDFGGKQAWLGRVMVVSLKPRAFTPWRIADDAYTQAHVRLMCCMKPCPNALIISGGAATNPAPGQVVMVSQQDLHSEANFGVHTVRWLVTDIERPGDN